MEISLIKTNINLIIFIALLFCCYSNANNLENSCQIENFENIFNKEFQLNDISEHMSQFGPSLYKSMPYVERVYNSEEPYLIVLLGSFNDEVDFSRLNRDEIIEEFKKGLNTSEITKNGELVIFDNEPITAVVTNELHSNGQSLINIRSIILASNNCIIGVNISIPSKNWSTDLKENLKLKFISFQEKLKNQFGKREYLLNNVFVKTLASFDEDQSQLKLNVSEKFLSNDISIKIKSCDHSELILDKEKFEKYYSLLQQNADSLITKRNIIKLENCNNGNTCTVLSNLSEKLQAFESQYDKITLSSEVAKLKVIDGKIKITSINAKILCQ